jgi:hypothetical protein
MSLNENVTNAFNVVFKTLQNIEKLIDKCKNDMDKDKYYMPTNKFLRYSSDNHWYGWIYYSFILLYQRKADGEIMKNGWINGPIYAVNINLAVDDIKEPMVYIAKMDFCDNTGWEQGCSPSNHDVFYNAINADEEDFKNNLFWGLQKIDKLAINLLDITVQNYKEKIFDSIDELSRR